VICLSSNANVPETKSQSDDWLFSLSGYSNVGANGIVNNVQMLDGGGLATSGNRA
jgi:hypothetical protein